MLDDPLVIVFVPRMTTQGVMVSVVISISSAAEPSGRPPVLATWSPYQNGTCTGSVGLEPIMSSQGGGSGYVSRPICFHQCGFYPDLLRLDALRVGEGALGSFLLWQGGAARSGEKTNGHLSG